MFAHVNQHFFIVLFKIFLKLLTYRLDFHAPSYLI